MPRSGANGSNYQDVLSAWVAIPPPPEVVYEKGACVGMPQSWFFSEDAGQKAPAQALACCRICPVREPCLRYALSVPWASDFGIWGGTNRNQRLNIRKGK